MWLSPRPGDHGRHCHTDGDARLAENAQRLEASRYRARPRLDPPAGVVVGEGDRQPHEAIGLGRQPREELGVAPDHRALGDDRDGISKLEEDLEACARESERGFERLVAIGDAAQRHPLAAPSSRVELAAKHLGDVLLDDDLPLEVGAGAPPEVLVVGPRVAIRAAVVAAAVGVEAPAETEVGAVVLHQRRARALPIDLELRRRWLTLPIDMAFHPWIRWVEDALGWAH